MRAIQNVAYGDPGETLELIELPEPMLSGVDDVLIEMEFAPINGNDLNVIRGHFAFKPALPSLVGNEGVGRVLAVGKNVKHLNVGDRVLPPLYSWTWRERLVVPGIGLTRLPLQVDSKQLAMLRINPPTAALILSEYVELKTGDWVVQNMANSGVGRSLIAIAKARGLHTLNFVRRPELIAELMAAGADVVLLDDAEGHAQAKSLIEPDKVRLGVDGLSGPGAARLIEHVSRKGALVSYGLMSGEMSIPVGILDLLFKQISVHGFFQSHPEFDALIPAALDEAAALMAAGTLKLPVVATYPLSAFADAVAHAKRGDKVLLDFQADR